MLVVCSIHIIKYTPKILLILINTSVPYCIRHVQIKIICKLNYIKYNMWMVIYAIKFLKKVLSIQK